MIYIKLKSCLLVFMVFTIIYCNVEDFIQYS